MLPPRPMRQGRSPAAPLASTALYVLGLAAVIELAAFPLAFYRNFFLERRYGFSSEPLAAGLRDHAEGPRRSVSSSALAGARRCTCCWRDSPRGGGSLSAALFVGAIALMANLAPTLLLPMFYKFRPLERESLRARLVALSTRAGVPVLGVYEWGMGEKTRGRTPRSWARAGRDGSSVSDTLLAAYSEDEIEVVMAHELGHHVHRDIRGALVVESVLVLAAFFCAASALNAVVADALGLTSPADIAGLPLLLLAGGGIMLAATPLVNGLSRRNERRADGYALAMTAAAGGIHLGDEAARRAEPRGRESVTRGALAVPQPPASGAANRGGAATRATFNVPP